MKRFQYTYYHSGNKMEFYGNDVREIYKGVISFLERRGEEIDSAVILKSVNSDIKPVKKGGKKAPTAKFQTVAKNSVTADKAIKATLALIKNQSGGSVSQAVFEQRMAICRSCPLHQSTSDCPSCGSLGSVNALLNSVKSKLGWGSININGASTKYCGFCGCSLSLLAATKKENYNLSQKDYQRPAFCWLNPTSTSFKNEDRSKSS